MVRCRSVRVACLAGCVVLVAGLAAGVWQTFGRPQPPEPSPPTPPPQRTTAELLVGTWRYVKSMTDERELPTFLESLAEYTADGRFFTRVKTPTGLVWQDGAYRLDGDVIRVEVTAPADLRRSFDLRVLDISEARLVYAEVGFEDKEVTERERVPDDPARTRRRPANVGQGPIS